MLGRGVDLETRWRPPQGLFAIAGHRLIRCLEEATRDVRAIRTSSVDGGVGHDWMASLRWKRWQISVGDRRWARGARGAISRWYGHHPTLMLVAASDGRF